LNNKENWHAVASRVMLFMGAILGIMTFVMLLLIAVDNEEDLTTWEYIKSRGSVSAFYGDKSTPTTAGKLFPCFINSAALLILFSNFGFYILPRWENIVTVDSSDGLTGDLINVARKCSCFAENYKRVEATSNWVTGEEGLFKIMYNILVPILMFVAAGVPLPAEGQSSLQARVHSASAISMVVTIGICELIQLFRGEKMHIRCTGKIQIMRLICITLGLICILFYVIFEKAPRHSTKKGLCAVFEALSFIFLIFVFVMHCFTPIKAQQSVFALGGTKWHKNHSRESTIHAFL